MHACGTTSETFPSGSCVCVSCANGSFARILCLAPSPIEGRSREAALLSPFEYAVKQAWVPAKSQSAVTCDNSHKMSSEESGNACLRVVKKVVVRSEGDRMWTAFRLRMWFRFRGSIPSVSLAIVCERRACYFSCSTNANEGIYNMYSTNGSRTPKYAASQSGRRASASYTVAARRCGSAILSPATDTGVILHHTHSSSNQALPL